jgi:hypothetical protein
MAAGLPIRMEAAAANAAHEVAQNAAERTAVLTGDLQAAWQSRGIEISNPIRYAGYQEFGTYKMPANPMLGPALESEPEHLEREMLAALELA